MYEIDFEKVIILNSKVYDDKMFIKGGFTGK
jgi:hypothetical protein